MTLKKFLEYIEKFENDKQFNYGISNPFVWAGCYIDVAFTIIEHPMTKKEILEKIAMAYTDVFYVDGVYGEFAYYDDTKVHFEESVDEFIYTDNYCEKMTRKIYDKDMIRKIYGNGYESPEMRLIKLIFQ